jgi:hypothetical protein
MTDLKLDTEIINKEKKEVSDVRKRVLFSILGALWITFLYSNSFGESLMYDKLDIWNGIPLIMFFLLLISSGIILKYIFYNVPIKGRLILTSDIVIFKKGKEEIKISSKEINSVKIFEIEKFEEDIIVKIELHSNKIEINEQINALFKVDREILRGLVESWKTKGIEAAIITTPNIV